MEEEIKLCYLEHELETSKETMLDYLNALQQVDVSLIQERKELIKNLKKAKIATFLTAGAYDACNFIAAVAILNASKHEYPIIDAFLVPMAFTVSMIAMSNRSRDAIEMVERNNKMELGALEEEYCFYGDKYIDALLEMTDHAIDVQNEHKTLSRKLGLDERISQ